MLNGGTEDLAPELTVRLRPLLGDGLARVANEERLTVVTGGTDAGIFRLFGEGLGDRGAAPCIGVAPAGLVSWAETTAGGETAGDNRVPLEPHHTHFVLVEDGRWGGETEAMLSLVDALSARAPALVVLANGGSVSRREVLGHVRSGREVVVLAGSGRLADEITDVVTGRAAANDSELAEIAAGRITVFDLRAPASALAELVRARLGSPEKPRRLALFAALPRLRWKPEQGKPFVSESSLARYPELRGEVDLLEREVGPAFRRLDEGSLRTQNGFRLGQLSLIVGGATASALGAVQTGFGGGVVALAITEAVVAGVLAGATVYIRGRNAQREVLHDPAQGGAAQSRVLPRSRPLRGLRSRRRRGATRAAPGPDRGDRVGRRAGVNSRAGEILDLYRAERLQDQLRYYDNRRAQFERAHGQLLVVSAVLLGATSTVSVLAGVEIRGKVVMAVLAAILPALATALAAYGALFAFDRHAKLYADAAWNLGRLEEPDVSNAVDDREAEEALTSFVEQVEKILRDEQSQWGQLAAEPKPGPAASGP